MKDKYTVLKATIDRVPIDGHEFFVRPMYINEAMNVSKADNKQAYVVSCCLTDENGNNDLTYEEAKELVAKMPAKTYIQLNEAIDKVSLTERQREEIQKKLATPPLPSSCDSANTDESH